MKNTRKHSLPARIARVALGALAGLLIVCTLLVGGGLLWLRTQSAAELIARVATEQLSSLGLGLSLGQISASLPQRLELKNIVLSDADGIFFTASGVTLRTRLGALLSGRLEIAELSLETPELFRLPNLPPSEAEPEAASSFSLDALPFGIRVDRLAVQKGTLHTAVIRLQSAPAEASPEAGKEAVPPAATMAAAPPEPGNQPGQSASAPEQAATSAGPAAVPAVISGTQTPPYHLELAGSASLEGSSLAATIKATLLDERNKGIRLELELDAGSGFAGLQANAEQGVSIPGEDSLRLSLSIVEADNGLLSLLLGDPQFPWYSFEIRGDGPVRDWRSKLSVKAGEPSSGTSVPSADSSSAVAEPPVFPSNLVSAEADINLHCASGSLWRDLVSAPDFSVTLRTTAAPGARLSDSIRLMLGEQLLADADVSVKQDSYQIDLTVSSAYWNLVVSNAQIRPSDVAYTGEAGTEAQPASWPSEWRDASGKVHGSGLAVDGAVTASITDVGAVLGAPFPVRNMELQSSLSSLLDSGFTGARARGRFKAGGVSLGPAVNTPGRQTAQEAQDYEVIYSVQADVTDRRLRVQELLLDGLGVSATLAGNADTITGALMADAQVKAADRADWQALLAQIGGFADGAIGGSIDLAANLNLPGSVKEGDSAPASGKLTLRSGDMRWPSPQLAEILGPTVTADASLSGNIPGNTDGQPGSYTLTLDSLSAGIINAKGTLDFTPGQDPDDPQRISLEKGQIRAALNAEVSDLAPLASSGASQAAVVSGPVSLSLGATGPALSPNLTLALKSPGLAVQGTHLRAISVTADAATALQGDISGQGALSAAIGQSPGGPISLSGRWQALLPQNSRNGQMKASLGGLVLKGAGVDLTADLSLALPLAASGTVRAEIRDWKTLAALAGTPLSGGAASLNLRLEHGARGQEANLDLNLASLRVQEPGSESPSFSVRDVQASLRSSRLLESPDLDLTLQTGRGVAGPLRWGSGNGNIKGTGGNGQFSFALLQQGNRSRGRNNVTRAGSGRSGNNREALALEGSYDFGKPSVTVAALAMNNRRNTAGMQLQKPAVIDLQNGMRVAGLDIAFRPSGKLVADATFAPGKIEAQVKLEDLSFQFFKLFTDANIPDGQLKANVDFRTGSSGPQGTFTVQSRVSATQDVSGVVAAASTAGGQVFEALLEGNLSPTPSAPSVQGSGVRRLPGIVWLEGSGTLGSYGVLPQARQGQLSFQLPLRPGSSGIPLPESSAPMEARLHWNGEIAPLWQAIPVSDRHLTGQALIDLNVSGSMNSPKLLVEAYMANGHFQDITNGILINGITLEARNTAQGDVRALIAANDSLSGNLAVEANLTGVSGKATDRPELTLRGQLDRFSPLHRDDLRMALSGIFGLNGPLSALKVTSDLIVNEGELNIAGNLGSSVPTLDVVSKKTTEDESEAVETEAEAAASSAASGSPVLEARIRVPRYFYIRGRGLDSEWEGDLRITGTASAPSLVGSLKPVRGYLDLLSRTFTISEGDITFTGGMELNPALNLLLINEGPNITAYARVGGSAKNPKLSLESRPPLPQDEVLAMVLFGKRTSELSRFEAIQLANSLRELSGFGGSGFDVLTGVRKSFGFDMLRIGGSGASDERATSGQAGESNLEAPSAENGSSDAGAPTLEAGKYINDSIYVGVEQGLTPESTAVRVEIELYPSVSLEGKSTSESSEVGIGWKKDY